MKYLKSCPKPNETTLRHVRKKRRQGAHLPGASYLAPDTWYLAGLHQDGLRKYNDTCSWKLLLESQTHSHRGLRLVSKGNQQLGEKGYLLPGVGLNNQSLTQQKLNSNSETDNTTQQKQSKTEHDSLPGL